MLTPREIVERFGGPRSMARALSVPPSTVMSWATRGNIPSRRIPAVIEAAREQDIELGVHDFFDLPGLREAS